MRTVLRETPVHSVGWIRFELRSLFGILDSCPSNSIETNFGGTTHLLEESTTSSPAGGERPHTTTDGRYAVYEKSVNNTQQIYLFDLLTNSEPVLVSQDYISGSPANGDSFRPRISGDGTTVVYHSKASNLVPGDLNNLSDVFLYRVQTGETKKTYNFLTFDESDGNSFYPDEPFPFVMTVMFPPLLVFVSQRKICLPKEVLPLLSKFVALDSKTTLVPS